MMLGANVSTQLYQKAQLFLGGVSLKISGRISRLGNLKFSAPFRRSGSMREDIGAPVTDPPGPWPSPEIWPTVTFPKPAGLMHVNTRPDRPGPGLGPKVPIGTMKVHMRPTEWLEVTPHPSEWAAGKFQEAMRVMSRRRPIRIINEDGSSITLKGVRSAPWTQHKKEYDKLKAERTRNFK